MRHLLVAALVLLLPVAADADGEGSHGEGSFPIAVEVTISVAGTVPLAGDDLVIDDTFHLRGLGTASFLFAPFVRRENVFFEVSGGGVSATGGAADSEMYGEFSRGAFLDLVTPLYELKLDVPEGGVDLGILTSFGLFLDVGGAQVTVGEEHSFLDGTASFMGTGFRIFLPEPGTTVLLVLGATAMAVWRGRGKIAGASG
jgi:hypothetical protein